MGYVVVHYSEIGLKKGNREYFERLLVRNIQKKLGVLAERVNRKYGYLLVETDSLDEVCQKLSEVPGVAYSLKSSRAELDMDDFRTKSLNILQNRDFNSFRVTTKRQNKSFPMTSMDVSRVLGEFIVNELDKEVDLEYPDVELIVEIYGKYAYLSADRFEGIVGLPVDEENKVVTLMSGGFDSPVAAYLMMKRGAKVILVHFQNYRLMKQSVEDKVEQLANALAKYQGSTILYVIPFQEIQEDIVTKCLAKVRMLVYRRVMLRISEKVMHKEKAKALVTGDNIFQVSSQTLENLRAVYDATEELVLTPLAGFNKMEIIKLSKEIGTFDISKLPYGDCCSFFIPEHPELRGSVEDLRREERKLDEGLWDKALEKANRMVF
ncbi:MAG: tRNA 4-thiouridine(8) synthase ThiI [Candidatus Thorarchaeota archaeon]|nr:tRNA 4-thiouridine(8) synthase ThiI [Candidatus Thorarchaeota archaeon]